jgi:hypothetical protein
MNRFIDADAPGAIIEMELEVPLLLLSPGGTTASARDGSSIARDWNILYPPGYSGFSV